MELFGIEFHKKTDFSDCLIGKSLKADFSKLDKPQKLAEFIEISCSYLNNLPNFSDFR
jgi:hypothetical protein